MSSIIQPNRLYCYHCSFLYLIVLPTFLSQSMGSLPDHLQHYLQKLTNPFLLSQDLVMEVQRTLCSTFLDFTGNTEEESELESLIDIQLTALRKVFRIPHKPFDETHGPTSKKLLTLFRSGKLGPFILDDLPDEL